MAQWRATCPGRCRWSSSSTCSGRYLCVLLGDLVNGRRFRPLGRRAANILEEMGMEDAGCTVKLAHGDASRRRSGVIVAELAATGNLKVSHDVVLFFRRGG